MTGPKLVTNSEVQTWKRCRRKWWLTYYRRLVKSREEVIGPRSIGNKAHEGLRAYYDNNFSEEEMWKAVQAIYDTDLPLAEDRDGYEKEHELVTIMLEGYIEWLAETGADMEFEVIGAERIIRVPFEDVRGAAVELIGKLDLRLRSNETGFRYFMDHKTTGSIDRVTKWAPINEQFLHYNLIDLLEAKAAGDERRVDGGIFNMLRKVKRSVRAKPPFYARHGVRYNDDQMRRYYARLWGEVHDIIEAQQRLDDGDDPSVVAYPSPKFECTWDCDFFVPCKLMDDDMSDPEGVLDMDYEDKDPLARYMLDVQTQDKEDA